MLRIRTFSKINSSSQQIKLSMKRIFVIDSLRSLMILCFVQEYTQYTIFKILLNPTTRAKFSNKIFINYNRRLI